MTLAASCSTDTAPPQTSTAAVPSQVSLVVQGEAQAELGGVIPLRVASLQGKGYEEIALLSVGLEEANPLGDGRMIRAAVDIVGYSGDGTYEIGGPAKDTDLPVRSAFFVEIYRPGTADGFSRFDDAVEACSVTVSGEGSAGELECPSLSGTGGKVQVSMTWRPEVQT